MTNQQVIRDLTSAAKSRSLTDNKPWSRGWSSPEYRRSGAAAIEHDGARAVGFEQAGVTSIESAVATIGKRPTIKDLYDAEELWSVVASLVGTLPLDASDDELKYLIESRLTVLFDPPNSLVAFALANVAWSAAPRELGPALIGRVGEAWLERLSILDSRGATALREHDLWWMKSDNGAIGFAVVTQKQLQHAQRFAEELFDDLIGLALLSEPQPEQANLFSGRSASHRPGRRGLTIDRHEVEKRGPKEAPWLMRELGAHTFVSGIVAGHTTVSWWGQEPFPLDTLTYERKRRRRIISAISTVSSVAKRIRTAARWYASSFYAEESEDSVLALGIAFDALLGEPSGSPGRVLAERFALLENDKSKRSERYKRFHEILYPARSSVAHGGRSSMLDDPGFDRSMAADVRWVAMRLWTYMDEDKLESEVDYRQLFDDLRWGLR